MGDLVHNERIRLTATYLNGLAVAVFAVGGVAPVLTILNAEAPPKTAAVAFTVIAIRSVRPYIISHVVG